MRQRNGEWLLVVLYCLSCIGFAFFMSSMASISTDPVELMRIVGGASGTVRSSIVLILFG